MQLGHKPLLSWSQGRLTASPENAQAEPPGVCAFAGAGTGFLAERADFEGVTSCASGVLCRFHPFQMFLLSFLRGSGSWKRAGVSSPFEW